MEPAPAAIRLQTEKILASTAFARAERLRRFLSFTVEQTLRGGGDQLKEYVIGVEVFERSRSYDPRIDPAVRVQARLLRGKLEEYYTSEGDEDAVLIEFPKGTYTPVFSMRRHLYHPGAGRGSEIAGPERARAAFLGRWSMGGLFSRSASAGETSG